RPRRWLRARRSMTSVCSGTSLLLLPLGRLRLEGGDVRVTAFKEPFQLCCLREQGFRNFDVLLEYGAILLAQLRVVLLQEGFALLFREAKSQLACLGQKAEHVTIHRRIRHGRAFAFDLWIGCHQPFVVIQGVRGCRVCLLGHGFLHFISGPQATESRSIDWSARFSQPGTRRGSASDAFEARDGLGTCKADDLEGKKAMN